MRAARMAQAMRRDLSDALGRWAQEEEPPRPPPRTLRGLQVIAPYLPQQAYRLIIDYLAREYSFCHLVAPCFHRCSRVSLLLICPHGAAEAKQEVGERDSRDDVCREPRHDYRQAGA